MNRVSRLIFLLLLALIVSSGALSSANSISSAAQNYSLFAPATNTRRPTLPVTNTPRVKINPTRTPTLTPAPTDTPSVTPTTIGPINYPDNINPLTGLPYPSDEARTRRNLIVKVSNYTPVVRPQSGLSNADIVYEYEVEGGVTRFAAIFRSQGSEHVGSIRSGRLLDLELMTMYNAILAYSGSNDPIKKMILEGYCINEKGGALPCAPDAEKVKTSLRFQALTPQFGDNCPPFCRFPRPGLAFEHTLFGNTFQMWDLAAKRSNNTGTAAKGLAFDTTPDDGGKNANDIAIKWYHDQDARWQYNPTDGKYYRWNTGLPHIDANTGNQISADNVVILQAYHVNRPDIYESETGSPAVEIQLWGADKAFVFRDGKWYQGIWRRNRDRGGLLLYYADNKTPIHLKPGQTWFEIVRPEMSGVTVSTELVDTQGTATPAALTATARAPHIPDLNLTQTAQVAEVTNAASAATAGITLLPPNTPTTAAK